MSPACRTKRIAGSALTASTSAGNCARWASPYGVSPSRANVTGAAAGSAGPLPPGAAHLLLVKVVEQQAPDVRHVIRRHLRGEPAPSGRDACDAHPAVARVAVDLHVTALDQLAHAVAEPAR